jgi:hypothetical protein
VAAQSKALIIFALSDAGIVGSIRLEFDVAHLIQPSAPANALDYNYHCPLNITTLSQSS